MADTSHKVDSQSRVQSRRPNPVLTLKIMSELGQMQMFMQARAGEQVVPQHKPGSGCGTYVLGAPWFCYGAMCTLDVGTGVLTQQRLREVDFCRTCALAHNAPEDVVVQALFTTSLLTPLYCQQCAFRLLARCSLKILVALVSLLYAFGEVRLKVLVAAGIACVADAGVGSYFRRQWLGGRQWEEVPRQGRPPQITQPCVACQPLDPEAAARARSRAEAIYRTSGLCADTRGPVVGFTAVRGAPVEWTAEERAANLVMDVSPAALLNLIIPENARGPLDESSIKWSWIQQTLLCITCLHGHDIIDICDWSDAMATLGSDDCHMVRVDLSNGSLVRPDTLIHTLVCLHTGPLSQRVTDVICGVTPEVPLTEQEAHSVLPLARPFYAAAAMTYAQLRYVEWYILYARSWWRESFAWDSFECLSWLYDMYSALEYAWDAVRDSSADTEYRCLLGAVLEEWCPKPRPQSSTYRSPFALRTLERVAEAAFQEETHFACESRRLAALQNFADVWMPKDLNSMEVTWDHDARARRCLHEERFQLLLCIPGSTSLTFTFKNLYRLCTNCPLVCNRNRDIPVSRSVDEWPPVFIAAFTGNTTAVFDLLDMMIRDGTLPTFALPCENTIPPHLMTVWHAAAMGQQWALFDALCTRFPECRELIDWMQLVEWVYSATYYGNKIEDLNGTQQLAHIASADVIMDRLIARWGVMDKWTHSHLALVKSCKSLFRANGTRTIREVVRDYVLHHVQSHGHFLDDIFAKIAFDLFHFIWQVCLLERDAWRLEPLQNNVLGEETFATLLSLPKLWDSHSHHMVCVAFAFLAKATNPLTRRLDYCWLATSSLSFVSVIVKFLLKRWRDGTTPTAEKPLLQSDYDALVQFSICLPLFFVRLIFETVIPLLGTCGAPRRARIVICSDGRTAAAYEDAMIAWYFSRMGHDVELKKVVREDVEDVDSLVLESRSIHVQNGDEVSLEYFTETSPCPEPAHRKFSPLMDSMFFDCHSQMDDSLRFSGISILRREQIRTLLIIAKYRRPLESTSCPTTPSLAIMSLQRSPTLVALQALPAFLIHYLFWWLDAIPRVEGPTREGTLTYRPHADEDVFNEVRLLLQPNPFADFNKSDSDSNSEVISISGSGTNTDSDA